MTWSQLWPLLLEGAKDTLYMTLWSGLFAYLIGLPLGVLLVVIFGVWGTNYDAQAFIYFQF